MPESRLREEGLRRLLTALLYFRAGQPAVSESELEGLVAWYSAQPDNFEELLRRLALEISDERPIDMIRRHYGLYGDPDTYEQLRIAYGFAHPNSVMQLLNNGREPMSWLVRIDAALRQWAAADTDEGWLAVGIEILVAENNLDQGPQFDDLDLKRLIARLQIMGIATLADLTSRRAVELHDAELLGGWANTQRFSVLLAKFKMGFRES
jgi:hypothetical protein